MCVMFIMWFMRYACYVCYVSFVLRVSNLMYIAATYAIVIVIELCVD